MHKSLFVVFFSAIVVAEAGVTLAAGDMALWIGFEGSAPYSKEPESGRIFSKEEANEPG
jgi:hypothetical protein